MDTSTRLGAQILDELASGNEYFDVLNRSQEEIKKAEEEMGRGDLPSFFRLHSRTSVISPRNPEEYLMLLDALDMSGCKPSVLKEITEKVTRYPISYNKVKTKIAEALRERSEQNIREKKKLDQLLFKALSHLLSNATQAFVDGLIRPWLPRMTSTDALVLSRVLMRGTSDREYMEDFILFLLGQRKNNKTATLLTGILIKKIKLSQNLVDRTYNYLIRPLSPQDDIFQQVPSSCAETPRRILAWNKLVLVFLRGYKSRVDLCALKEAYAGDQLSEIELEIRKVMEANEIVSD